MIINQFFPDSGLNVVFPWYLVIHRPPCTPFHTVVGWLICTLFICKGFPYRLLGRAWEEGLGAEAEMCHPILPNTGNMTPQASLKHQGLSFLHSRRRQDWRRIKLLHPLDLTSSSRFETPWDKLGKEDGVAESGTAKDDRDSWAVSPWWRWRPAPNSSSWLFLVG